MQPTPSPPTIDTVSGYLRRRGRSAHALTAGEAATLAIAVVRGCATAPSRAAPGEWRLTPEGRPVLVAHPGGDDVLAATVTVLNEVASLVSADVRPGFARLRDGVLTDPPPTWALLEKRLLAVVEPQPLVLGPLAPTEAVAPRAARDEQDATAPTFIGRVTASVRRIRPPVLALGVGVAAVLAVVAMTLVPRVEPATTSEDHPARVASAAAATAPPGRLPSATPTAEGAFSAEPDSEDAAPVPGTASSSDRQASPSAASEENAVGAGAAASETDDVRAAAASLLASLAACADEECTSRLRESAAGSGDPAPWDPAVADLDVVDDFGGLAVVRLSADGRTQYVTLVRQEDRWLVRSVRDVADQPS
ncbi:hypothetical protein [Microbacterium sp. IEGM 1404]|uniref:hypothetical protein n=1 Tax=Microbacterium sp. IEGM 1404 TaxID=3047084 RepID=UPI0024B6B7B7|nr:hypothetical protein [Microbacterium sp. IEGM 1404]MDI9890396.1 hypothetical protein [Microbacterium sp. IEGM 1404]